MLSASLTHTRRIPAALAAAVLLAGCAGDQVTGQGGAGSSDRWTRSTNKVATITVSPNPDTLSAGGTQTFTAVGRNKYGTVVSISPTWSVAAGGGTVTSGGVFTAGATAGTFANTVVAASGGVSGSATVVVTGTTTGGSPTTLLTETFADANLAARGWYDIGTGSDPIITTSTASAGATASLALNFAAGGTTPTTLVRARHAIAPTSSVYIRYWVRYSDNWVGSGHTYHPHEFYFVTSEDPAYVGPSFTHLTTYVEDNYQNGGYATLAAQDAANIDVNNIGANLVGVTENRASSGCNGYADNPPLPDCYQSGTQWFNDKRWESASPVFLATTGAGYKGNWNEVEAYFQLNSIVNNVGQTDGVMQYWINGQLVIDQHNVLFRTGVHPTMQFNQFIIGWYIGDGSPVAQTAWVDDLVVMTARP